MKLVGAAMVRPASPTTVRGAGSLGGSSRLERLFAPAQVTAHAERLPFRTASGYLIATVQPS